MHDSSYKLHASLSCTFAIPCLLRLACLYTVLFIQCLKLGSTLAVVNFSGVSEAEVLQLMVSQLNLIEKADK